MTKQEIKTKYREALESKDYAAVILADIPNKDVTEYVHTCLTIWKTQQADLQTPQYKVHFVNALVRGFEMYGGVEV